MDLGVKEMSEQEIRRLEKYDVKSITRTDARDCYDVILTPRLRPEVRLRIRKEDLARLAAAVTSNKNDVWELNLDLGTLYEVVEDNKIIPIGLKHLVSAEIDDEETAHFYGYYKGE
jgi:hypothetical protein